MKFASIDILNSSLRVFRDDLYPYFGGGNKGRKIHSIEGKIKKGNYNAVVTTGGVQSNHCRAVALMAACNRWKCSFVLHGSMKRYNEESGNAKIMRHSGAEVCFVNDPKDIGSTMDSLMDKYQLDGLTPYYIWGGGHDMEGGLAYIQAVELLKEYCVKENWYPKTIFLPSGTGSTQAGIMAGLDLFDLKNIEVIGISVARERNQAENITFDFYNDLCEFHKIKSNNKRRTVILDDYLCGGYEKYNNEILQISENSIKEYGFVLDTTYSGKAFYGMLDYLKCTNMKDNVLFWHTGGIFNFLSK